MRPYIPDAGAIWRSDRGLSAMLVFLILAIFVAAPLVSAGIVPGVVLHAAFCLLFLSGVFATFRRRAIGWFTTALVVAAIGVRATHAAAPRPWLAIATEVFTIALLILLTALVLKQVFRAGPVTSHRVQGSVVVYLLIGLVWASAYQLLEILRPGSFQVPSIDRGVPTQVLGYFSFVTLTTVGFGDVTALHPVARALVIAEALIGQLYPAILIARLVSLELISQTRKDPGA
jgi:ion channel